MKKYLLILLIPFLAFTFTGNPPGGWYQQFVPDLGGRSIQDIFFLDSLTGWAVTNATNQNPDTTYVLKTTNSGDNWIIQYAKIQTGGGFPGYFKVCFLNVNTAYTCGVTGVDKTTDGGTSWISLNAPLNSYLDMSVINEDTIYTVSTNSLTGGVFRTTNGGVSWAQQLHIGSQNPARIYMYDANLGFITNNVGSYLRRTTNSGQNWDVVPGQIGFTDVKFYDENTGWKCGEEDSIKKTTDGGATWQKQLLPPTGGFFSLSLIEQLYLVNADTLWGVGARASTSLGFRGLIYKSTNGGQTWGYQLPDTNTISIGRYSYIDFINPQTGWAYTLNRGVHTVTGGDTTVYLGVSQIGNEIPPGYKLYQNYPNPFNPKTTIEYEILKNSDVKVTVYDITGKNIIDLVRQRHGTGTYRVDFPGGLFPSGIYFYSLIVNDVIVDTKKMLLIK